MYFVLCTGVRAEGEFSTDLDVTYKVNESGITEVINKVTLTNLFSNLYATSYSIVLDSINPANARAYSAEGTAYSLNKITDNDKTTLRIEFPDTVVGKDKSRTFYISFEESSFAVRTGEVWEISIPRLSEDATFNSYNLNLQIPEKLGLEAYISPLPREKSNVNGYLTYNFSKADVEKTGITAGFGAFQVFSFTLNYHLENPLAKSAKTEITIPPDTAYQKVYYSNISPKPTNMTIDSDGNWIAEYTLSPRERVDVTAVGHVQIFSNYRPFQKPTDESLNQNLLQSDYWNTTNPEIVRLANELKTPKAIYDYVSQTLKYDYARVRPNVERLGAVRALDNPTSAICMEFTDLFVAISRAAGIPAREVNGYAYTENPEIQPLSLVNDVLHAWPEYYDKEKEVWIPVDPTWGSTTGGVDYFSKLDLRHFTFVAHGKDAVKPYPAGSYKLGSNPQKDVFVSFGSLPEARNSNLEVTANIEGWIPLISNRLNIKITNPGPSAVYKVIPNIYFDGVKKEANINILELLPFQESKSIVEIPFSFLGINTPNIVKVEVLGEEVIIPTNKKHVIIYNLLFIFVVTILILVTIMFRLKKWKFPKKSS
jgi:transglutaminase-like putative cysteine protease